jgi:hypothetical protein
VGGIFPADLKTKEEVEFFLFKKNIEMKSIKLAALRRLFYALTEFAMLQSDMKKQEANKIKLANNHILNRVIYLIAIQIRSAK